MTELCEAPTKYTSTKTVYCNTLNARADMRIPLSSNPHIKEIWKKKKKPIYALQFFENIVLFKQTH